jgi:hypothetical protein
MRHKNIVGFDFLDVDRFRERILSDKWVEQQVFAVDFCREARVAVVGNFHAVLRLSFP